MTLQNLTAYTSAKSAQPVSRATSEARPQPKPLPYKTAEEALEAMKASARSECLNAGMRQPAEKAANREPEEWRVNRNENRKAKRAAERKERGAKAAAEREAARAALDAKILKAIGRKQMLVSEIARAMHRNKDSLRQHMERMRKTGVIRRSGKVVMPNGGWATTWERGE